MPLVHLIRTLDPPPPPEVIEAASVGFLFGYLLARTINKVIDLAANWFVRECELAGAIDSLSNPSQPDAEHQTNPDARSLS